MLPPGTRYHTTLFSEEPVKLMCKLSCLFVAIAATFTAAGPRPSRSGPELRPEIRAISARRRYDETHRRPGGRKAGDPPGIGDAARPSRCTALPAAQNTGAAVVVFPGGGYNILAMDLEGTEVCEWLNSLGVNCALVKYRVPVRAGLPRHGPPCRTLSARRGHGPPACRRVETGSERIGVLGFLRRRSPGSCPEHEFETRTYDAVDEADKASCRPDFTLLIYAGYLTARANTGRCWLPKSKSPATPPELPDSSGR